MAEIKRQERTMRRKEKQTWTEGEWTEKAQNVYWQKAVRRLLDLDKK